MRLPLLLAATFAVLSAAACNHSGHRGDGRHPSTDEPNRMASTQPAEFTGTLRGNAVAIGGETTGWRLEGDGATGGLDLDVSHVRQRAQSLQGRRVSVSGKMTTRNWPERGQTQVLVVDRVEEAAQKEVPGAR